MSAQKERALALSIDLAPGAVEECPFCFGESSCPCCGGGGVVPAGEARAVSEAWTNDGPDAADEFEARLMALLRGELRR